MAHDLAKSIRESMGAAIYHAARAGAKGEAKRPNFGRLALRPARREAEVRATAAQTLRRTFPQK